jgi:hypothetical protein
MPVLLLLFNSCKTTIKEVWRGREEAQNKAPHIPMDTAFCAFQKKKEEEREI